MKPEHKNPHLEVPEDDLVEEIAADEPQDEEQPASPPDTRPASVSEADWIDQQTDVPFDEEEWDDQ